MNDGKFLCDCCNRPWPNRHSLAMHLFHQGRKKRLGSQSPPAEVRRRRTDPNFPISQSPSHVEADNAFTVAIRALRLYRSEIRKLNREYIRRFHRLAKREARILAADSPDVEVPEIEADEREPE